MAKKKQEIINLSSRLQELFAHKNWVLLWQTYTLNQKWPILVGKDIAWLGKASWAKQLACCHGQQDVPAVSS